jgi:hypothetical protein
MFFVLLIFAFLISSIKPFLFTINNLIANYYIIAKKDLKCYRKYISRAIKSNSDSFKCFRTLLIKSIIKYEDKNIFYISDKQKREVYELIKLILIYNDINIYRKIKKKEREKIEIKYRDNFYLQKFINNLEKKRNWEHLDEVSYFFLSNKKHNKLTISIFEKIKYQFSKTFLINLCDFLFWKKNYILGNYIKQKFKLNRYKYKKPNKTLSYKKSVLILKDFILKEFKIKKGFSNVNLIEPEVSGDINFLRKYWHYSNMSNIYPFGDGSFSVNTETISGYKLVKLFNSYLNNNRKSNARGGIWHKRSIKIDRRYYVFSFDYFSKTGHEKMRFWLSKYIKIFSFTKEKMRWKKMIFILDNRDGKIDLLKPLIRMYGTGSSWINNVFLGKLDVKKELFNRQYYLNSIYLD